MGGGGRTEGGEDEHGQNKSWTENTLMLSALAGAMEHPRKGQGLLHFRLSEVQLSLSSFSNGSKSKSCAYPSLFVQNKPQHSRNTLPGCLGPFLPPCFWLPVNWYLGAFFSLSILSFLLPCQVLLLEYCLPQWTFCFWDCFWPSAIDPSLSSLGGNCALLTRAVYLEYCLLSAEECELPQWN